MLVSKRKSNVEGKYTWMKKENCMTIQQYAQLNSKTARRDRSKMFTPMLPRLR